MILSYKLHIHKDLIANLSRMVDVFLDLLYSYGVIYGYYMFCVFRGSNRGWKIYGVKLVFLKKQS